MEDWRNTAHSANDAAAKQTLANLIGDATHVFLWTFTFAWHTDRHAAAKAWNHFMALARARGIELRCLRVFEVHPGGHGIHIHFVTPDWWHVNRIRSVAKRAGFGRIDVQKITADRAGYVLKYIRKQKRHAALKGAHRWRACGKDAKKWLSRVSRCISHSNRAYIWRWLQQFHPKWKTMNWHEKKMLVGRTEWNSIAQGYDWVDHWYADWDLSGKKLMLFKRNIPAPVPAAPQLVMQLV
jgi:hypothetical protein